MRDGTTDHGSIQEALLPRLRQSAEERVAIECGDRRITFAQLDSASSALAERLAALGIVKGGHVGVLAADRPTVVVAAIAAWKLGAVFVPLDPGHPVKHLERLCSALDVAALIADEATAALADSLAPATALGRLVVAADPFESEPAATTAAMAQPSFDGGDPIYIYSTSGTTGRPKAVVGRSGSLRHFLEWEVAALGLPADVRVSQLTSPTHDPYLRDVFAPLLAGGTICIPPDPNVILSGADLRDWIERSGVNLIHCTPTIFRNLCNAKLDQVEFAALRWVLLAGEQLYGKDLACWYERFGDRIRILNLYGPTETTLAKFYHPLAPEDAAKTRIPIGRAISDTRFYILPSEEAGAEGELAIATPHRSLGYYRDEALTGTCFVEHCDSSGEREIVYRTGDLVRLDGSGALEFVGRRDGQVKLFGERIELEEITGELLKHPEVRSGVVHTTEDSDQGSAELIAYYVSDRDDLDEELRLFLADSLPRFKVPRLYAWIDAVPLKPNGKLDRAALPRPPERSEGSAATAAATAAPALAGPADGLEARLTDIWMEILARDEIGPDEVFMEIGGDSLAIMLLVARVSEEFNYEVSLWAIFEDLTIAKLAELIREGGS